MLKIVIIQIGKTKEKELQSLIAEYQKRISPFANIETITVRDEREMKNKLRKSVYVIKLEDKGEEMTSEGFAQFIEQRKNQGDSRLVFLIGPPEGFRVDNLKEDKTMSLSQMTFSHQTIRLLLAEQIYRAISILEGKPFPK